MRRRPAAVTALLLPALGCLFAPAAVAADPPAPRTPIEHVVVMTQEARSFDSYLGGRPGVDGIPAGVCLPLQEGAATPCQRPFALSSAPTRQRLVNTAETEHTSVAGGAMNGFVLAQTTRHSTGRAAMGHYLPADLPVLSTLADHGVVFDRWFSAVPGGGITNQLFAVTGVPQPDAAAVPESGWPDAPVVFDRLEAAGVSWKVYVENYEPALTAATAGPAALVGGQVARVPLLAMPRYERDPALMAHVTDLETYYADLAAGTLPAVSWIVTTTSTERLPAQPTTGQGVVRDVVNSLGASSAWPSSLFLLTYDNAGGWYDHVVPPVRDGESLGLRVPAVLVSPYARRGSVDHTTLDSAAVLSFLQSNWGLAPLSDRVSGSPDLSSALRFDRPPGPAVLIRAAAGDSRQLVQPDSRVIVAGYVLALLLAAATLLWAARGRRPADAQLLTPDPT